MNLLARRTAQAMAVTRILGGWVLYRCAGCLLHLPLPLGETPVCRLCGCGVLRPLEAEGVSLRDILKTAEAGEEWRPRP